MEREGGERVNSVFRTANGVNRLQVIESGVSSTQVDGYHNLAIAIVSLACDDYRKEVKVSKREGAKTAECYAIERFFRSDYGDTLTFGTGRYILEELQKEAEMEFNKTEKKRRRKRSIK